MEKYKVGDIFYLDDEYSARADFCNYNRLMIVEISSDEKGRRFQIQEVPPPTKQELINAEIWDLKNKLDSTDYQALKFAEGSLTEREFAPIKEQRQAWRDRINDLEEALKNE